MLRIGRCPIRCAERRLLLRERLSKSRESATKDIDSYVHTHTHTHSLIAIGNNVRSLLMPSFNCDYAFTSDETRYGVVYGLRGGIGKITFRSFVAIASDVTCATGNDFVQRRVRFSHGTELDLSASL